MKGSSAILLLVAFLAPSAASAASVSITEIMYDLSGSDSGREWVELYNAGPEGVTIVGGSSNASWRIYELDSSVSNRTLAPEPFQGSMTMPPNSYAVVAQNGSAFLSDYPSYTGTILVSSALSLSNTSQTVGLRIGSSGEVWSEVVYTNTLGGDGDGNSLQLVGSLWQALLPTPGEANEEDSDEEPPAETSSEPVVETAPVSESAPPLELTIGARISGPSTALAGADAFFEGRATGTKGEPLEHARFIWNFGDGSMAESANVLHAFMEPGRYVVVLTVASGKYTASDRLVVSVIDSPIRIAEVSLGGEGLVRIENTSGKELDLSGWFLNIGGAFFSFPKGTRILGNATVPISSKVTGLPVSSPGTLVALVYPNGEVADAYGWFPKEEAQSSNTASASVRLAYTTPAPAPLKEQAPEPDQALAAVSASAPISQEEGSGMWLWVAALIVLLAAASLAAIRLSPAKVEEIRLIE